MNMYGNHQVYSVVHQQQNWCMDYVVDGPAWMAFKQENMIELNREYPGVSNQTQSCEQLGFQKEHISPLYGVQKRTFVDPHSRVTVTNAYWSRGTMLQELTTNIHDLHTEGLLNSHASRWTTTNVGHLHGGRHSVMTLSELNWLTDKLAAAKAAAAKAAAAVKQRAGEAAHAVADKVKEDAAAAKEHVHEAAHAIADKVKEDAAVIIHDAEEALKREAVKIANQVIDDAEREGQHITREAKQKIIDLSIQLKRGSKKGIRHTRHEIDAKLDPLKKGPVSTAVINYFENQEVNIDKAAFHEIKQILHLLKRKAIKTVRKGDNKLNHYIDEHRPVAVLLI